MMWDTWGYLYRKASALEVSDRKLWDNFGLKSWTTVTGWLDTWGSQMT